MKTILVLDSDMAFALWLGQGLAQSGYSAVPALSAPGARELLGEMSNAVDLLVVNPVLPDTVDFIEMLRGLNPRLKIVVVTDKNQVQLSKIPYVDLHCRKPEGPDDSGRRKLIAQIETVLPPFDSD
ncbi:MAG TPA: hypothetical protein VFA65_14305 [Bryobacteraceae bacterium]|nr:hypothetical protein [Bryobacteraceae bacterium]